MTPLVKPVMFIAGGTGSIGREIAAQALASGWSVVIQGRSQRSVDDTLRLLHSPQTGSALSGLCADIRYAGAINTMVEKAAGYHQRLDAVVDCLVTGPRSGGIVGEFSTTDPESYLEFLDLSVVYLERLSLAALPWLKESRGCLVAFASDAGIYAAPRQTLIGAARSATVGFIRNLAAEVARDGVRAHCVAPSFVLETATAQRLLATDPERIEKAMRRAGLGLPTPRDIAPLVLFLCSEGARRMTGQVISINGGLNT